ncbi:hypothetical protein [Nostoc sp.]
MLFVRTGISDRGDVIDLVKKEEAEPPKIVSQPGGWERGQNKTLDLS